MNSASLLPSPQLFLLCAALPLLTSPQLSAADAPFEKEVKPLLENYCTDCHGLPDEFPEADFSLARFKTRQDVQNDPVAWHKILVAIEDHHMPPGDQSQPTAKERTRITGWIRGVLAEPEFGPHRNPGKPVLRRLTRLEYNNTVRDLLGLETDVFMFSERLPFDKRYFQSAARNGKMPDRLAISAREYGARYPVLLPNAGLPGDSRAEHGFSNRGDAQNLSAVRLEEYVELAERIAFHPELLSRAERMQEIFPNAEFQRTPQQKPTPKPTQIVDTVPQLAPKNNIAKTAAGSDLTLEQFRTNLKAAFAEDRGGVFAVSQGNSVIAGKGGVLTLAYGKNAIRSFGINPNEDIWLAGFATAEESSGESLFTNKKPNLKQFFFGFQKAGNQTWSGIGQIGLVVLSRRGQAGTINITARFNDGKEKSIRVVLQEGAGTDNTFVSLTAPSGQSIKQLHIDGRDFSGPYVLLDDLAFITRDAPTTVQDIAGRELPPDEADETETAKETPPKTTLNLAMAKRPARERLSYFLRRAFRRPVDAATVDLYFQLYESSRSAGADDEKAMRRAIQGVLASPNFLYLIERGQPLEDNSPIARLTDYELAARLSYFLWSSPPDEELLKLAAAGRLQDAQVLEAQARRMLKDARSRELSENFFVEWLKLRELWSAQPDRRKFKTFYDGPQGKRTLAPDLFCEALLLFETILVEDRSVLELIEADYTFINQRLAKFYDAPPTIDDQSWQRISLTNDQRGGVLTMGATLTLTSFPHRTSPIKRGAWFLETIFNRPPPPPKIAVAEIDEQNDPDKKLTLRQKTEMHRANAACAVCHNRIDPPGFALENFDAIGQWRERDGAERIDPSGELPGAGSFAGPTEFKQRLLEHKMRFVRGFTEHLLSYALCRKLEYYDTATVDQIVEATAKDNYRLSRVIVEIVQSPTFRHILLKPNE